MQIFRPRHLVLAIALALAGCGGSSPEARIGKAEQALQRHDLKAAEIELKTVLQDAPGNVNARLLLARTMQEKGNWADSEKELRKAQEHGATPEQTLPMLARAWLKMGNYQELTDMKLPVSGLGSQVLASVQAERANAYLALRKPEEAARAIAEGDRALGTTGGDISNDLELAKTRLALVNRQPEDAMSILDGVLRKDANFVEAMYLKAQLLIRNRDKAGALKLYERITTTKPSEILAHLAISDIRLLENDLKGAEEAIAAAEKVNANMLLVKYARASLSLRKGEFKKANDILMQILRNAPGHWPSVLLHAQTSYQLGNFEQSLKSASRVLAQAPTNLTAAKLVISNQLRLGNIQAALDVITPLLAAHPEDIQLLTMAGEAHGQRREYAKAAEYLDRAGALQPRNPIIKLGQARSHAALGRGAEALRELEEATGLSDKFTRADRDLIMVYMARREFDKALKAVATLERKLPNDPAVITLQAAAYLGKNDRASARKSLERAVAAKPDFYPAVAYLARLDLQDKNPAAARKRFEALLDKNENSLAAMLYLAELSEIEKNEKEMLSWLERAAKAHPNALPPRTSLVRYYLARNDTQQAVKQARAAVDANPQNAEALSLLGNTQLAAKDATNAIASLQKVIQLAPNSANAHYQLGLALVVAKQPGEARASLEKALTMQPGYERAVDTLIKLDLADKKPEAALQRARQFTQKSPKSAIGYKWEAFILMSQQQYAQAAKVYDQVLARGADSASFILQNRALILAGNTKAADNKLAAWLQAHPNDVAVQAHAAEYRMRNGQNREAIALYETALRQAPQSQTILNNLAILYQRVQDKRALATAEQAYKLNPKSPAAQDTYGWILVEQGQAEKGVDLLRTAAAAAPKSATVRYHHAAALARTGKQGQAKQELSNLLKDTSDFPEIKEAKALLATL